jgi:hypothetical protein
MTPAVETQVRRLETLLARVQARAAEPRVATPARNDAAPIHAKPAAPPVPIAKPAAPPVPAAKTAAPAVAPAKPPVPVQAKPPVPAVPSKPIPREDPGLEPPPRQEYISVVPVAAVAEEEHEETSVGVAPAAPTASAVAPAPVAVAPAPVSAAARAPVAVAPAPVAAAPAAAARVAAAAPEVTRPEILDAPVATFATDATSFGSLLDDALEL